MTAVLVLAICAAVVLVLVLPFRRARRGESPDSRTRGPTQPLPPPAVTPGALASAGSTTPSLPNASENTRIAANSAKRALGDEKERLLAALAELRFDFEAGKLSRDDFEREDARLRERTAILLREQDDRERERGPDVPPGDT